MIPDDLERTGIEMPFDYRDDLDVEWTGGPGLVLPHQQVLDSVSPASVGAEDTVSTSGRRLPDDRDGWLLKPLFSYAGGGILFSPTDADVAAIPAGERHLYVLQERVAFTPTIDTPHGATQAELRAHVRPGRRRHRFVLPLVRWAAAR